VWCALATLGSPLSPADNFQFLISLKYWVPNVPLFVLCYASHTCVKATSAYFLMLLFVLRPVMIPSVLIVPSEAGGTDRAGEAGRAVKPIRPVEPIEPIKPLHNNIEWGFLILISLTDN